MALNQAFRGLGLVSGCLALLAACTITLEESDGDSNDGDGGEAGKAGESSSAPGGDAGSEAGTGDAGDGHGGTASQAGGGGAPAADAAGSDAGAAGAAMAEAGAGGQAPAPVEDVSTIGVGVTADSFCTEGTFTVTVQPKDADGNLVISGPQDVTCTADIAGDTLQCTVQNVECIEGSDASGSQTVVLVILDESGSMDDNDPEGLRAEACSAFVDQLGSSDIVAVSDFGHGGVAPASALRTLQSFTADKELARAACENTETGPTGTPIYGSVLDAVEVFLPAVQEEYGDSVNYSVLMLSDGEPDSDVADPEVALEAAKAAEVPIYTLGLGPAAEGSDGSNTTAIEVLQELSQETGGAYASAIDPEGLEGLFEQVGSVVREGRCQISSQVTGESFPVGQVVNGSVVFTAGDASADYSFMVPASELDASMCD